MTYVFEYWYYKFIAEHSDHYTVLSSGVEITVFEYTLRHVTTKFAHMNGHWKVYNFWKVQKNVIPSPTIPETHP